MKIRFLTSTGSKVLFSLAAVIFAVLGMMDAGYMTYNKVKGILPPCRPPFACDSVLESKWASIGPIPIAFLGLLYYTLILTVTLVNYADIRVISVDRKIRFHTEDILLLLTTGGLLFSSYLVFIMGIVLHAWCLYCILSASCCILLWVTTFFLRQSCIADRNRQAISFKRNLFHFFYTFGAKRIFFLMDAEFVHNRMTQMGIFLGQSGFTRLITQKIFNFSSPKLVSKIDGIRFPNPVGLSAGFDYNGNLTSILPAVGFGFATIGTVTLEPYEGNAKPRLGRYPKSQALLVNKGFKSLGAYEVIRKLEHQKFKIPIGISIGSTNKIHESSSEQILDIVHTFQLFEASHVLHAYYELNISCPNTLGGQPFTTPARLERLLLKIDRLHIKRPVYLKMPIDLTLGDTIALLKVAKIHHIQGVIFGNLTKDKNNPDVDPIDHARWLSAKGNLSGKPTFRRSNERIAMTKQLFGSRFTIIGTGGIFSPEDAAWKIKIGADLVQLITGMIFEGPQLVGEINEYLAHTKAK